MNDQKATLKILLFLALICTIIIVPFIIFSELNFKDEDFPEYQNIIINENRLEDEVEYKNIKHQLQNDYYFTKLGIMIDYNSENFDPYYLEELVWHFIFNYEIDNTKYFSKIDKDENIYCMKKNRFKEAFEELYNVDITEHEKVLKGFYKYLYVKADSYCFDVGNVSKEYDNDIKIGIERLAMVGTSVIADINVYEYYTSSSNNQYVKSLQNAIDIGNYTGANNIIKEDLHGTVQKKQIKFKINRHGDYFKYTVLSMKKIDY